MKKPLLIFFLFAVVHGSVQGVNLEEQSGEISLDEELIYIEDVQSNWDFADAVIQLQQYGRKWQGGGFPNFGLTSSSYWATVRVSNDFSGDKQWLVKLNYPILDRIDFYYRDKIGTLIQKTAGDTVLFNGRDLDSHSIFFTFPVFSGVDQELVFRMQTKGSMQFPLSLMSFEEERNQSQIQVLRLGLYFGIVLVMVLYNFFIWASTRDRSYLYYLLFISCQGFYQLATNGLSYQYLWPESPRWAQNSVLFFAFSTVGFALLFSRSFMDVSRYDIRAGNIFNAMAWVALLVTASVLLVDYNIVARLMVPYASLCAMWLLAVAIWIAIKGYRPAKFFLAAWAVLIIGTLVEVLQRSGFNIPLSLAHSSIQIGSAFEIVLLSLGLGDRINTLTKEKEKAQRELLIANQLTIDTLQHADHVKDEFIANVSHELRTPLTGIIGLSEIILQDKRGVLGVNDDLNLKMIRASGHRLSNLINDVIDLSAIKENQLRLNKAVINLNSICAVVVRMSQPLIGTKPIQLTESYPPRPIMVEADEARIQQILFNLIANAIKFTKRGWVSVAVEVLDLDARVIVTDTGIGISQAQQSQIFNRFYQVDSAESRKEGGAGLGLSISQKLVELHGTEIILRSELGRGSTFYFDLPLLTDVDEVTKESVESSSISEMAGGQISSSSILEGYTSATASKLADAQADEVAAKISRSNEKTRTILLVDDEYLNLHIVTEHLEASYNILTALNGHEALEIMQNTKPDLVILDLMMPVMTGFELCEKIRQQYTLDELPVIILTAKNRVEDLVKGLNLGANDYISKPFTREELQIRVSKQIELLDLLEVKQENQQLVWQLQKYRDAELKLRQKDVRLIEMLDITGDAYLSTDERGEIVSINSDFLNLFEIHKSDFLGHSINSLSSQFDRVSPRIVEFLNYPFNEESISNPRDSLLRSLELEYTHLDGDTKKVVSMKVCILPLNLGHEFFLVIFQREESNLQSPVSEPAASMRELVTQLNDNPQRSLKITEYLQKLSAEQLRQHRYFLKDKDKVDRLIKSDDSDKSRGNAADWEQEYRHSLVKLMQDCHHYWQKVTGESIINLAEKSKIWSVSIDNGRLRTRAMNRYLDIDKLPRNPRWRQVARTAFFVLSQISDDVEAKAALELSVTRLQDIVELRALT